MENPNDFPDIPCEVRIQALYRYHKDGHRWTHFNLSNRLEEDIGIDFFLALNEDKDELIAESKTFGTRLFCAVGVGNFSADTFVFPGPEPMKRGGGIISNSAVVDYINHPCSSLQINFRAPTKKFAIMRNGEQKCEIELRENLVSVLVRGLGGDLTKVQITALLVFGVKAAFTAYHLTLYPLPLGHTRLESRRGITPGMSDDEVNHTLSSMTHLRLKLWSFMDFSTIVVNCISYTGKILFIFELVSQLDGSEDCYNLNVKDTGGNLLFTVTGMALDDCLRVFSVDSQSENERTLIGYVKTGPTHRDDKFFTEAHRDLTEFHDASDKFPILFAYFHTNKELEETKKIANASNCVIMNRLGHKKVDVTFKWETLQFEFTENFEFSARFKMVLLAYGMKTFLRYLMKVCKEELSTPMPKYIKQE